MIWPLFHYVQDVLDTNPLQEQWDAYVRANEAFCEVAKKQNKSKNRYNRHWNFHVEALAILDGALTV